MQILHYCHIVHICYKAICACECSQCTLCSPRSLYYNLATLGLGIATDDLCLSLQSLNSIWYKPGACKKIFGIMLSISFVPICEPSKPVFSGVFSDFTVHSFFCSCCWDWPSLSSRSRCLQTGNCLSLVKYVANLKGLTYEKRGGLNLVSLDWSRFKGTQA